MDLRSKQQWDKFVELYQKSGLSKADYLRSQKITDGQYYYYAKFHRNKIQAADSVTSMPVVQKQNFIPMISKKEFKIKINDSIGLTFDSLPEPVWMANLIKSIGDLHATV